MDVMIEIRNIYLFVPLSWFLKYAISYNQTIFVKDFPPNSVIIGPPFRFPRVHINKEVWTTLPFVKQIKKDKK